MSSNKVSYKESWKRNLRAWKIWWDMCPGVFVSKFLMAASRAISPYVTIYLSARILDELAGNRDGQQLVKWISLQLLAGALLAFINGVLLRWSNYEFLSAKRMDDRLYMKKMLSLDYADIDRQYVYDLYSQIIQTENWAGWGVRRALEIFEKLVSAIVMILAGVGLTASLFVKNVPEGSSLSVLNNPFFMVGLIVLMLLIAIASPACMNKGNAYWNSYAKEARLGNRYFTFFGFMNRDRNRALDLRMYCQQENVCGVYVEKGDSFGPKSLIAKYAKGAMGFWFVAARCVSVVLTCVIYIFVCLKAWGGAFGVGAVTQYVGAITNMFSGIGRLIESLGDMRANGGFLEPCYEFLDIPNNMYQGSLTTEKRADRQYEVEFKDVSFRYPGTDIWALRHVNMKFKVGSRLAVVGMNGSGKTTFIKLLCRLYDPTEGEIRLNGIDIRKYRYDDYINVFSVVFQDFQLMALPLGENVAGSREYDAERVEACLRDAGFDKRLEDMPAGLETYLYKDIDKEGVEISGGEAQKIAIARALYKDAPFIILDEPMAALDPIAEAEIYSKFNDIAGDKTAIYISHRLSSCKFCDEIAVFHEGAVIQQGTHEELVADEKGKYYELWHAQAQYYTEKTT